MPIIEMKSLTKGYDGRNLFENYHQQIFRGEFVAITGDSGCGKSTLLNIMGLLERYDEGVLIINGKKDVYPNSREAQKLLRVDISYLFQNSGLVDDETVVYNIRLGLRYTKTKASRQMEIIGDALSRVGLAGFEKKRIYQLSGGERQRVAIARVLVKPSTIVLADEPTGSLDAGNRDIVMGMLQMLNRMGKTIIIATHDRYVANLCQREICLNNVRRGGGPEQAGEAGLAGWGGPEPAMGGGEPRRWGGPEPTTGGGPPGGWGGGPEPTSGGGPSGGWSTPDRTMDRSQDSGWGLR